MTSATQVQDATFLGSYARTGSFTDCYVLTVQDEVSLPELIEAFYTTPIFKVERWILARAINRPSTDVQAHELATGKTQAFSAWKVEHRSETEILMKAGQTRSWLSVSPVVRPSSTKLLFGSAVVPVRAGGNFGFIFHALLGFHRIYSRLLLSAAARQVAKNRNPHGAA